MRPEQTGRAEGIQTVSNLDRLNELRRTAKALGMTGYGRMKTIDLAAAVEAEQAKRDVEQSAANEQEIDRLRVEFETAGDERKEEIRIELARMGAVVYPQGTEEHERYRANLRAALADPNAFAFLPGFEPVASPDREIEIAEAIDADDRDALAAIGAGTPDVVVTAPAYVQDPAATRYQDVERWTNDRLYEREAALEAHMKRRTTFGADRRLTENRLSRIRKTIETRGL